MERTTKQNSQFHSLLSLRKFGREEKAQLVTVITGGRTTHSSEMTYDEMELAISRLQDAQTGSEKKMRAKIINIGRDIFGLVPKDEWQQEHYDALNKFLVKTCKKPLHKLLYKELIVGVTAMERWRDSAMKTMVNDLLNPV